MVAMPTTQDIERLETEISSLRVTVEGILIRLAVTETLHQSVEKSIGEIKASINKMGEQFEKSVQSVKNDIRWGVRIVIGAVLIAAVTFALKGGFSVPTLPHP